MSTANSAHQALSLEHLVALNDEILALVRAGVPLETALGLTSRELPGVLGAITDQLAQHMRQGQSLPQALASTAPATPPLYRALVEVGLRSGQLTATLEGISGVLKQQVELRRLTLLALTYPLLLFALSIIMLTWMTAWIAPRLWMASQRPGPVIAIEPLVRVGEWAWLWAPALLLTAGAAVLFWWRRSGKASSLARVGRPRWRFWPSAGRVVQFSRWATFAEVLALLIEQQSPLGEALLLAAESSGDERLVAGAAHLSNEIAAGRTPDLRALSGAGLPSLVAWSLASHRTQAVPALRRAGAAYLRRAAEQTVLVQTVLPAVLTVLLGGTITAVYAIGLFLPWTTYLYDLARP